jgi:NAD(P)-dependent dehydrogenase (short-subunit alcohol dehydrogenase family)
MPMCIDDVTFLIRKGKDTAQSILSETGRIDVLINNAAEGNLGGRC